MGGDEMTQHYDDGDGSTFWVWLVFLALMVGAFLLFIVFLEVSR